jgi:hypothetical protein
MEHFIDEWVRLLRDSHGVAGIPLIAGGLGLMLFGWRLWKICVVLAFGVIGTVIGLYLVGPSQNPWPLALLCGGVLGLASYYPVKYSIALLGGLIIAAAAHFYLANLKVEGAALWVGTALALFGGTAFAVINRRHVVIVVTSFLGAVLLVSGLATWVMSTPALLGTARQVAASSMVVVPFMLLVPTVMSCFYQVAEVHRLRVDL